MIRILHERQSCDLHIPRDGTRRPTASTFSVRDTVSGDEFIRRSPIPARALDAFSPPFWVRDAAAEVGGAPEVDTQGSQPSPPPSEREQRPRDPADTAGSG